MRIFKDFFGFILTFVLIFSVLFIGMNFSAFSSMVKHHFYGEENAQTLAESAGIKKTQEEKKLASKTLIPKGAKKFVKKEIPPLLLSVTPLDFRLVIPKIGKNIPLVKMSDEFISDDLWGKFENEVQDSLRKGVVHYPGTANPGQAGNAFFTGHSSYYPWDKGNYKDVFANLNKLEVGDEYIVYFQQEKFSYKVTEKKEVRPSEVGVLKQPEEKKLSTLMTCWPLGTTLRRLVIVGEQTS